MQSSIWQLFIYVAIRSLTGHAWEHNGQKYEVPKLLTTKVLITLQTARLKLYTCVALTGTYAVGCTLTLLVSSSSSRKRTGWHGICCTSPHYPRLWGITLAYIYIRHHRQAPVGQLHNSSLYFCEGVMSNFLLLSRKRIKGDDSSWYTTTHTHSFPGGHEFLRLTYIGCCRSHSYRLDCVTTRFLEKHSPPTH